MSNQETESSVSYATFLQYLVSAEDLEIFPAISTGTPVWVKLRGVWRAFLINDRPAPAKSSSTHVHALNTLSASATAGPLTVTSVTPTWTDIVSGTITWPTVLPFVKTVLFLTGGEIYLATGSTGTFDIRLIDVTQNLSNSFFGFGNIGLTGKNPASLLSILSRIGSFVAGSHTYTVQGRVSDATTTLNVDAISLAVVGLVSASPLTGT